MANFSESLGNQAFTVIAVPFANLATPSNSLMYLSVNH